MTKQIVDNLQKKSGGYHCAQRIGDVRTDSQLLFRLLCLFVSPLIFSLQKFGGFNISWYVCGVKSVLITIIIAYDYNIINIQ